MRSATICLTCWLLLSSSFGGSNATSLTVPPEPPVWPETFHAVAVQNRSGSLALVDLYYEWQRGRNANLIHSQLGTTLYDIEYTNHTSYYFNLEEGTCRKITFPVGILTPDWLANATYLGTENVDAHDTHVWTKADGFIKYYADVHTGLPVRWIFFDGAQFEILSFVVNETLPDADWQAPSYCFTDKSQKLLHNTVLMA
ncbi:hypothetical protein COCSUDRAFT_17537 [Coccomyxa subellipsoidea C-169]|uniref:Uncharacterized protein n=1 Tax=Coccomyxa subellipsoidea (strain C-169) TaxID=574566 RepID=I0YT25_COCSC|nr:hypothetical protein COCSUDRAFT_17537 [Coccomyxa subellipsoidea C-169]EIE21544.1 hypothetical protein COCSUDRAFT_17537 [Coccomyxa subellipsoidea C-169]|eukprot:XP_005646088.1 hypothetical protein COCSUDRAFT_17537 [Coccomyxa subellipsoidea C-169]